MLEATGYVVTVNMVQSSEFGSVQRRPRWYMIGVLRPAVSPSPHKLTRAHFAPIVNHVLQAASARREPQLSEFIFPPSHPHVREWLAKLQGARRIRLVNRHEKWQSHHMMMYESAGLQWPPPPYAGREIIDVQWQSVLTDRETDLLQFVKLCNLQDKYVCLDISQSITRAPASEKRVPCVCPSGRLFYIPQGRLLTPTELLACQGVTVPNMGDLLAHPWSLVADLAGNAFCAHAVAPVLLASLAVAAW